MGFTASATPLLSPARCPVVGAVGEANLKPQRSSIVFSQPSAPPQLDTTSSATELESLKREQKRPRPCVLMKASQILLLTATFGPDSSAFQASKNSRTNVCGLCSICASEGRGAATTRAMCPEKWTRTFERLTFFIQMWAPGHPRSALVYSAMQRSFFFTTTWAFYAPM